MLSLSLSLITLPPRFTPFFRRFYFAVIALLMPPLMLPAAIHGHYADAMRYLCRRFHAAG